MRRLVTLRENGPRDKENAQWGRQWQGRRVRYDNAGSHERGTRAPLDKLEAALGYWREALRNYSGDAGLRECEPRVLASLGRIAEARQCYLKILVDFPDHESAKKALAALPPNP